MTTYCYSRVSTNDQTTDNQIGDCAGAGYVIDSSNVYCDVGVSGAVPAADRPQWRALIGRAARGDIIVVSKIDRLGRNAGDILATVDCLEKKGIKLICLQFGSTDFTSPTGKLLLTMLSAMAEFERDLIAERTRSGMDRARSEGVHVGAPPKDRAEVHAMFDRGMSNMAIHKETGLSRVTIIKWRNEYNN